MRSFLALLLATACAALAMGGSSESARLVAQILPGVLEVVESSVAGPHFPVNGPVASRQTPQNDAVTYEIKGLTINDLNGDGLGWKLTAAPEDLHLTQASGGTGSQAGSGRLIVGSIAGFRNPSHAASSVFLDPTTLAFESGSGIAGYTVDFKVSYDVPANARPGSYSGAVVFQVIAE